MIGGAVAAGVIVAAAAAARAVLPGWLRGTIERAAGEALGRELKIAGAFELSISLTPTITASDITLANATWASTPFMVRAGRIRLSVDLLSLWSGPLRIRDATIEDVHVVLETSPQGSGNWVFETQPGGPSTSPPFVIERAAVRGFDLVFRERPAAPPLSVSVAALDVGLDAASKMVEVRGTGQLDGTPWDIAGRLGPYERLFRGRDLEHSLTGHLGQTSLSLKGRIHEPKTLGGPDVEVKVDGPDIVAALAVLGLKSPLTGPFRVEGRLAPQDAGVSADLRAESGGVTASARGSLKALLSPGLFTADVAASGPDAAVVGSWARVVGLPRRPFDLAGRLRRDGRGVLLDDGKVRVGRTSLTVGGRIGPLPRCVGTELQVAAAGSDLSELSALTRLRLPRHAFKVSGRFLRRADGLAIDDVVVGVAGATIHAAGTIGEPPVLANLDLSTDSSGPDASFLSGIARVDLPAQPFEIRGRVARRGPSLELDGITGRLGRDSFDVSAQLVPSRGLVGTDARVRIAGDDLARAGSLAGLHGLPAQAYEIAGHVRVAADAYELEDVAARAGGLSGTAHGHVGARTPLDGTSLECCVRGSALTDLAAWGVPAKLPADPFTVSGRLGIDGGLYRVDGLAAELGADRITADGPLGSLPDIAALDVTARASGPDLAADLGRFLAAAGVERPAWLPGERFTVAAGVRRVTTGFEIRDARAEIGNLKLAAGGTLGLGTRLLGSDFRFEVEAPDASIVSRAVGTTLPEGTLRGRGRASSTDAGLRLEATQLSIGAAHAELSGTLSLPPSAGASDVDLRIEGPDLAAALAPPTGLAILPSASFSLSAHVHGSPERFTADRLDVRLEDSDLAGSVSLRLDGKPFVEADLQAQRLDLSRLLGAKAPEVAATGATATPLEPAPPRTGGRARLIPDQPIRVGALQAVDGRLRLAASELTLPGVPLRDVSIVGELRDGALTLDHAEGTGEAGGRASARLSLVPDGEAYRIHAEGRLEGGRLALATPAESKDSAPSLDVEYELDGAGRSVRELAATAEGRALVMLGAGRVPSSAGADFLSSGVAVALLDALNPFRKSSLYTALECGVMAAGIDDGKAVLAPIALRTDKMTVVGNGKLDLDTEDIDLAWTIKPRSGAGISAASVANPYIRLAGTLASPHLEMKPLEAVASTGAAVASLGMTILYRGIYNRITAEKKVCVDAIAATRKQDDKRAARKTAPSPE